MRQGGVRGLLRASRGNGGTERDEKEKQAEAAFEKGKALLKKDGQPTASATAAMLGAPLGAVKAAPQFQQAANANANATSPQKKGVSPTPKTASSPTKAAQGSNSSAANQNNSVIAPVQQLPSGVAAPPGCQNHVLALPYLTAAIELSPATSQYYATRAAVFTRLQEYKLAVFDYTMSIQVEEPQVASPVDQKRVAGYYCSRGQAFRHLGKIDDSIADFKRAAKLDPENGSYYYEIGVSLYELSDKQRALELFSIALEGKAALNTIMLNGANGKQATTSAPSSEPTSRHLSLPQIAPTPEAALGSTPGSHFYASAVNAVRIQMTKTAQTKCLLYRGNTRREVGDVKGAITDLQAAVANEENGNSHNLLGLAFFDNKDFQLAATHFQRACDMENTTAIFFNNLGLALFQLKRYEDALNAFNEAHTRDPENANIFFNRGNTELVMKLFDEAISDFDEAIHRVHDDENIHHSKGIAFQELGQTEAAIRQFLQALQYNPVFKPSLFHLGLMYHIQSEAFMALDCFSKVIKLDPLDRRAYESLGLVYCDLMYFDLAVAAFSKAIELLPTHGAIHFYKGKALLWLGRYTEAIECFNDAVANKCEEPQVYNARAIGERYIGKHHRAVDDLTKAISMDKENVEYFYNRSQCYIEVKEYDLAIADLSSALQFNQNEAKLFSLRGKACYALKRYEEAIADMRRALELDPNDTTAHYSYYVMGLAYANSNRHREAIPCFSTAATLQTNNPLYAHERAKSLQCVGNHKEALVSFCEVVALQPCNAHAYFRRAFSLKALRRLDDAAGDFETAKRLQPKNLNLMVNYKKIFDIEYIELCAAGEEPPYEEMVALAAGERK